MNLSITITLDEAGQVGIQTGGPASASKVAMLGLLEFAKGAILSQQEQPRTSPVLVAQGSLPTNRLNGRG